MFSPEQSMFLGNEYRNLTIISVVVLIVTLSFFVRKIMIGILSLENSNLHQKRLKSLSTTLSSDSSTSNEFDKKEWIDKITSPSISSFFSNISPTTKEKIEHKLKLGEWDKLFDNAIQYQTLNYILKFIGVVTSILMWNLNKPIAVIWGSVLFFGLSFFLNNSYNNRKEQLLSNFPDFIRITEGYLSSGMPFKSAIEQTIPYVDPVWKPILAKFAIDLELDNTSNALDNLQNSVDLFEVREFVSIVKLTLEQGGKAHESFTEQADRLRQMQRNIVEIKIGQRQTMSVALQGPILLSSIVMFALPTIGSVMEIGLF